MLKKNFSYYLDEDNKIVITKYDGTYRKVIVPSYIDDCEVKKIDDEAFANNLFLEEIKLPNTVTEIGISVFQDCEKLRQVKLSDNLELIGSFCFFGCRCLEYIELPSKVDELSYGCFSFCNSLKNLKIKGKIKRVCMHCFDSCYLIKELHINGNHLIVDSEAFQDCCSLEKISLTGLEYVDGLVFMGCDSLKIIILKACDRLKIAKDAFEECENLESIYYKEGNDMYEFDDPYQNIGLSCVELHNLLDREFTLID